MGRKLKVTILNSIDYQYHSNFICILCLSFYLTDKGWWQIFPGKLEIINYTYGMIFTPFAVCE